MSFGKEIKRLRLKAKWSAQKMADVMGVRVERLRKWEQKDSDPKEEDTQIIENKFGMSLEKIKSLDVLPKFQNVPNILFTTSDAAGMVLANQIEIMSELRVMLSILAELQAPQMEEKTLPTHLLSIYRKMVQDEAEQVRRELKQISGG